jgi:5-methylcytosine-specific restriction enzyme subunit McrC
MTLVIELREHAQPTKYVLDGATGRALAASGIVEARPDPYTSGTWSLAARSKVGAITVTIPGGSPVTVRIVPKVSIGRLFFLLGYVINPKGWRDDQVDVAEHEDLLPALAHAFERQTERALRQGLLQGYRTTEESALVVRGRIRHGEQIRRHYGMSIPVELEYDEFTADIAENQLLRAAVERLLSLPGIPSPVRTRLLHQRARLADVSILIRGHQLPSWRPTRLNTRYHHALHLADMVLRGASVEHYGGAVRIDGFLFDMNKVFEDFVTIALREALIGSDSGGLTKLQARHHLDEDNTVLMKPDFVWYDDASRPLAVADAKYKAEKPEGFPGADLYQLLAYCTVLGLADGHLIYAKGNASHAAHQVRNTGVRIHQHALELDQAPGPLLAEIANIAAGLVAGTRTGRQATANVSGQTTRAA